jgi:hypothetical protein
MTGVLMIVGFVVGALVTGAFLDWYHGRIR